ncbi:MAG: Mur ligase family protein [Gordonibacter pamelaeae]
MLVLGLGKSGRAAVEYLLPLRAGAWTRWPWRPARARRRPRRSRRGGGARRARGVRRRRRGGAGREAAGVRCVLGTEDVEGSFDLGVASPGIPSSRAFYRGGGRVRRAGERARARLAREPADSRWVAVTGTNGKTTTTSLTAHLLDEAGLRGRAVGNIGDPCIGAVGDRPDGRVRGRAVELPAGVHGALRAARGRAAERHARPHRVARSFEAYRDAKLKIWRTWGAGGLAVLDATNDVVPRRARLRALGERGRGFAYVPMGTAELGGDMRARCGSDNAAVLDDGSSCRA